jgi:DNA segregation ATPase FtsK/SpoIIIE-like protein
VDTAPDSVDQGWSDQVAAYFTFGPGGTVGVWVLTILGFLLMVVALVAWFYVEDQKMKAQVARLRAQGLRTETMPGGDAHHAPGSVEA